MENKETLNYSNTLKILNVYELNHILRAIEEDKVIYTKKVTALECNSPIHINTKTNKKITREDMIKSSLVLEELGSNKYLIIKSRCTSANMIIDLSDEVLAKSILLAI